MELEFKADTYLKRGEYPRSTRHRKLNHFELDWSEFIFWLLRRLETDSADCLAMEFHLWLVDIMVETARSIGIEKVALSGGCFQNRLLTERAIEGLRVAGFQVYWHQRVPPNDGGLALGQIRAAVEQSKGEN